MTYQIKQSGTVCSGTSPNPGIPCGDNSECTPGTCQEVAKFDKKATKNLNVFVEDQFTNIRVNAGKVDLLMVPATLCDGDNDSDCVSGANAAPAADSEEHYKCYKAGATKKVCSANSSMNALEPCDDNSNCGTGICTSLAKFAKGTNAHVSDSTPGFNDNRAFDIAKLTHICKAVEKTIVPGGTPEGTVNPNHRLLCYKSKGSKGRCDISSPRNTFGACKKEEDCGGTDVTTHCDEQLKFDKTNPLAQGLYVNDQFDLLPLSGPTQPGDYHRVNAAKEEMVCMPACENPTDIPDGFTSHVMRAVTLEIPNTGNPGDGQDVDDNMGTCQPGGCSGGIDNVLGVLPAPILSALNDALQDSVDAGDINIILEIDDFANGAQVANAYIGDLDSPPGCTDQSDGGQICNYEVSTGINPATCEETGTVQFPIVITNMPGPADVKGGGIGSNLFLELPFSGAPLTLVARNVKVGATVAHSGGVISTATGALGGAISQRELKKAINGLPEGQCVGGGNDGGACTVATADSDCGTGITCDPAYLGGFDKAAVIIALESFLVRDINLDGQKTCEGGGNSGEPCSVDANCPDPGAQSPVCDDNDAYSLGIKFTAIDAAISTGTYACDKPTCSIF
jgi:hypothetical protein